MKKRAKKAPIIEQPFIWAFEGNLKRKSIDEHEEIQGQLEDIAVFLDDDEAIHFADLPQAIPEVVRKRLVEKSKAGIKLLKEVQDMLAVLETASGRLYEKRERQEEKQKPHCKACGQVIPPKKRR